MTNSTPKRRAITVLHSTIEPWGKHALYFEDDDEDEYRDRCMNAARP
jgi:hypothetical protein